MFCLASGNCADPDQQTQIGRCTCYWRMPCISRSGQLSGVNIPIQMALSVGQGQTLIFLRGKQFESSIQYRSDRTSYIKDCTFGGLNLRRFGTFVSVLSVPYSALGKREAIVPPVTCRLLEDILQKLQVVCDDSILLCTPFALLVTAQRSYA